MNPCIRVMPPWLQNQIAAGEVVERPAAAVKELVENAIDAGATRVQVEFEQGGKRSIRVLDNGYGMSREDAEMALERHATSKLNSLDDLRNIRTFGFRGEALPSIASVSRFTLRTRTPSQMEGTSVTIDETGNKSVTTVGMPPGTEVLVNDLFYNVPARRKFLKTDTTEAQNIIETMQRFALVHHQVFFSVKGDNKVIMTITPEKEPLARYHQIFGKDVISHLYECVHDGRISINGFISDPALRKKGTGPLFIYVNSRFVKDKLIIQAIRSGYGTLMPHGEYPYAILNINVPPEELDVNVHPMKSEVRFENSQEVFGSVARAIRRTMADNPMVARAIDRGMAEVKRMSELSQPGTQPSELPLQPRPAHALGQAAGSSESLENGRSEVFGGDSSSFGTFRIIDEIAINRRLARTPGPQPESDDAPKVWCDTPGLPTDTLQAPVETGLSNQVETSIKDQIRHTAVKRFGLGLTGMRYLGQFANCFLLGQLGNQLVVIDQHAAHERVLFEQLRHEYESRKVASRSLLLPLLLEVEPRLLAVCNSSQARLEELGFRVDQFGPRKVAVHSVPAMLKERPPAPLLLSLLEILPESPELSSAELFHKPLSTMACHSAVRGGDPMEREEVIRLLEMMDGVDLAAFCPHGRPVVTFFSENEVARWFKRS